MLRRYELLERVQSYDPGFDSDLLNKAYVYASKKHREQKRASGDPYISHPIQVAAILADMHLDQTTIIVALLHDTIEDTTATRAEIDSLFGTEIGYLVEGLTKVNKFERLSFETRQAENLRKLFLAICEDVRILLVKLADRLHNMRTLCHVPSDKRLLISKETMDIYAPLAGRIGMQDMREELEELAFSHINPKAYKALSVRLDKMSKRNGELIIKIEKELKDLLSQNGIENASVKGRQKRIYSISHKMQMKSLSFEQLSDVYGFRIVVDNIPTCYQILGIVHTRWPVVPGYFKDYISTMKQNGYRSIHTTIVGPSYQRIELQIRTKAMDTIAEYGVAAHALYKDGRTKEDIQTLSSEVDVYSWLRRTIRSLAEEYNSEDFLQNTKMELFQEQVFCFTPKGRLIALPRSANPIDFAYAVHTDIGNSCVGAKINGKVMALVTKLKSGDEVEIICSSEKSPPIAWERIVVTGKARSAIRRSAQLAIRKQYFNFGKFILESDFKRFGKQFVCQDLKPILGQFGKEKEEDIVAAIGRGEITSKDVLLALFEDFRKKKDIISVHEKKVSVRKDNSSKTLLLIDNENPLMEPGILPIRGIPEDVKYISCLKGAIPGDQIIALMQNDHSIAIYPTKSFSLQKQKEKQHCWIDLCWDPERSIFYNFVISIRLDIVNQPGSLNIVLKVFFDLGINVRTISVIRILKDFTSINIELEVSHVEILNLLIENIAELDCISTVYRVFE
ncbi:bifunctional (p)ppGpp synthetase/guanosine-3',5'-bis(diphosphate) 3'-pyrophosphohydrolase [Candidatus Liberibacter sp.]|uniref:RelA/SpoT family protein n=1 Tax=Candidatus Liberibacter sp. TaxID=34022 RepID=UPI0015F7792A|nr:bifunctional (p)ppGpp synthetase/guanosine-3',5'-bis(diphosphate) 3'-pyrophosphohydrolase [Candidatus Liberibacter sp.]MBA5723990.1 bifunctional (p)ppGpp synthetase/guanosine-3',5'-bis(diphosphate) 3'-pyrophosphohydrolase [Candidatus Liberibacter sp.]